MALIGCKKVGLGKIPLAWVINGTWKKEKIPSLYGRVLEQQNWEFVIPKCFLHLLGNLQKNYWEMKRIIKCYPTCTKVPFLFVWQSADADCRLEPTHLNFPAFFYVLRCHEKTRENSNVSVQVYNLHKLTVKQREMGL